MRRVNTVDRGAVIEGNKTKDALAFLQAIHGELDAGDHIELRFIFKFGSSRHYYTDAESAVIAALRSCHHSDVYFGIATRDGKGGKKQNILHIPCVWADLDDKTGEPPSERLKKSPLPPSIVVGSGKGLHCYWLLDNPTDAGSIARIETINKAIAAIIGGDSTHDATRVLRLPGTLNHKYDPPLPVELVELSNDRKYSLEQLESSFAVKYMQPKEMVNTNRKISMQSRLPCRAAIWNGVESGNRNNAAYQLANDLKKSGVSQSIALDTLSRWNSLNRPPLEPNELDNTVASVYSTSYAGLGCDKHPMSDFCQPNCPVKGKESTEKIEVPPIEPEEPPVQLPVWSWSTLLKREITPPEFIVDGLIPRRGVTLLTGEGGIGKSFIVIELAYAVASGGKFLHHFNCTEGPVLMVDLENDEASITRRIQKITEGRREGGDIAEDIPVYVVKKGDIASAQLHIDEDKGKQILCSTVERYRPSLLVVDPLVAIHSKDENDNIAMRAVVMYLQEIARKYNLAVVLLHHPRKRSVINDAGQMIRGASDLRNAVDSHLFLRKVSKEQLIMEHDKSRHAPPLPKFTIQIADNEAETATYIRSTEGMEKGAAARECLLSIMQDAQEWQSKDLVAKVDESGISRTTALRALANLVSENKVIKRGRGTYMVALPNSEPGL